MEEPVEMISGWLCKIMIARGNLASARLDSLRYRGEITHVISTFTATEKRSDFNWRNVCLEIKS